MLFNSYSYEILYAQFHWIYLQGDIKLLLVTVNNRLKFEIEIVHDISCHPIFQLLSLHHFSLAWWRIKHSILRRPKWRFNNIPPMHQYWWYIKASPLETITESMSTLYYDKCRLIWRKTAPGSERANSILTTYQHILSNRDTVFEVCLHPQGQIEVCWPGP